MLNLDRSAVKHGTQNTQNDCHQWLSGIFRVHQIRFWPWLRSGPRRGSLQRSPDPLAGLRGPTSKGRGGKGEGKGKEEGERKGTGGTDPPFANSWTRPCSYARVPLHALLIVNCGISALPNVIGNSGQYKQNIALHVEYKLFSTTIYCCCGFRVNIFLLTTSTIDVADRCIYNQYITWRIVSRPSHV